jgi:hypothetical protein
MHGIARLVTANDFRPVRAVRKIAKGHGLLASIYVTRYAPWHDFGPSNSMAQSG